MKTLEKAISYLMAAAGLWFCTFLASLAALAVFTKYCPQGSQVLRVTLANLFF